LRPERYSCFPPHRLCIPFATILLTSGIGTSKVYTRRSTYRIRQTGNRGIPHIDHFISFRPLSTLALFLHEVLGSVQLAGCKGRTPSSLLDRIMGFAIESSLCDSTPTVSSRLLAIGSGRGWKQTGISSVLRSVVGLWPAQRLVLRRTS